MGYTLNNIKKCPFKGLSSSWISSDFQKSRRCRLFSTLPCFDSFHKIAQISEQMFVEQSFESTGNRTINVIYLDHRKDEHSFERRFKCYEKDLYYW